MASASGSVVVDQSVRSELGWSDRSDPCDALDAIFGDAPTRDAGLAFVWIDPSHGLNACASAIRDRFDGPVLACTSASTLTSTDGYASGGIAAGALWGVDARIGCAEAIETFGPSDGEAFVAPLLKGRAPGETPQRQIGLLLTAGTRASAASLAPHTHAALGGIRLIGGAPGDGAHAESTALFDGERFRPGIAVLAMVRSLHPIETLSHHHFRASDAALVITHATPDACVIHELDGRPAIEVYAQSIGDPCPKAAVCGAHPLLVSTPSGEVVCGVRSILPDGSLQMDSPIESGAMATVGDAAPIAGALDNALSPIASDALVIGFDSTHRRIDGQRQSEHPQLRRVLDPRRMLGVSTHTEQHDGRPLSHTLTATIFKASG